MVVLQFVCGCQGASVPPPTDPPISPLKPNRALFFSTCSCLLNLLTPGIRMWAPLFCTASPFIIPSHPELWLCGSVKLTCKKPPPPNLVPNSFHWPAFLWTVRGRIHWVKGVSGSREMGHRWLQITSHTKKGWRVQTEKNKTSVFSQCNFTLLPHTLVFILVCLCYFSVNLIDYSCTFSTPTCWFIIGLFYLSSLCFCRTNVLPELFQFPSLHCNALLLQRWVIQNDGELFRPIRSQRSENYFWISVHKSIQSLSFHIQKLAFHAVCVYPILSRPFFLKFLLPLLPTEDETLRCTGPFLHCSAARLSKDVLISYAEVGKQ